MKAPGIVLEKRMPHIKEFLMITNLYSKETNVQVSISADTFTYLQLEATTKNEGGECFCTLVPLCFFLAL